MNKFEHSVPESSAFFQGHIDQYFSKSKMSYQVILNFEDRIQTDNFNVPKFRPIFCRIINKFIALRARDGWEQHQILSDQLKLQAVKFVDNIKEEFSGYYRIEPRTAICRKKLPNNQYCNHYFELGEPRGCGHNSTEPFKQITFIAYCDECGRTAPLHWMTNLRNNCPTCHAERSLNILLWDKSDSISTYKVKCTQCGHEAKLYFISCDHYIRNSQKTLSIKPRRRFKGVAIRASTIIHPLVYSIPDIPNGEEIDNSGRRNTQGRNFSEAFHALFPEFEGENHLFLPEFRANVINTEEFWVLSRIITSCDDLNLDVQIKTQWSQTQFMNLMKTVIKTANHLIDAGGDSDTVIARYGIDLIERALTNTNDIDFDENDLQGIYLGMHPSSGQNADSPLLPKKQLIPNLKPNDYPQFLKRFGLKEIMHIANFNMVQAVLGTIKGSTRREPLLFDPVFTGVGDSRRPTVFVREFLTEGILFHLDYGKILEWAEANKMYIDESLQTNLNDNNEETRYRSLITYNNEFKDAVYTLLHTYSHMLIQQSTINTGLDIQSLAEIVYPKSASFFIYSTSSINIGGLEDTYHYHLEDWLHRTVDLALDCPQDPACMIHEGGSCNACSYLPEFVCENFNQNLDRSALIGGPRYTRGYLSQ
jgi:Zn ribbon nucleic-acid-binding protein